MARKSLGEAALIMAAVTPNSGFALFSPTLGSGATPKSMPLFSRLLQAQGPLIMVATSPRLKREAMTL